MKVDFQIIHSFTDGELLKSNLLLLLKNIFDESTTISTEIEEQPNNIEDWSIFNWIETKYNHRSDGDKYIAGFILELEENFKEIIQEFGTKLQEDENIFLVTKYDDEGMQVEYKEYAKKIFVLEMRLREVISFIFLDTYKEDYHNLLEEIDVNIIHKDLDAEYYTCHFENEFFFLLFSDYLKINNVKKIKELDLMEIIINSNEYGDLKQKIQNRGIIKEVYNDFLARIKRDLKPIENFRNCIAHNRSFTDTMVMNYEGANNNLDVTIDEFWGGVQDEDKS